MSKINEIIRLIDTSYSQFHVCSNVENLLKERGFAEFFTQKDSISPISGNFYIKKNDSTIIAFKIPAKVKDFSFLITASHTDSPTFKLKPNPIKIVNNLYQLNVEPYGSAIYPSWLDKPLSIAGRITYSTKDGIRTKLVNVDKDLLIIPNLCLHMNRDINSNHEYKPNIDMIPIMGITDRIALLTIADILNSGDDYINDFKDYRILAHDLFLYPRIKGITCGLDNEFLHSPKLDNLISVYASLLAFLGSENKDHIEVFVAFDNEEVGSSTKQGADSTLLGDTLKRIVYSLGGDEVDYFDAVHRSIMLSVDNAHANHPNFPQISDSTTHVNLNEGVVLKYNARQLYTTDSLSAGIVKHIARKCDLKIQEYTNRSDIRGGCTLGSLSNTQVSLITADIGIPELAMHSSVETCGTKDIDDLFELLQHFYSTTFTFEKNNILIK